MNVFFHTTTAISVVALFPVIKVASPVQITRDSIGAFTLGIMTHAALDYIPHCYPIASKLDAILGVIIIIGSIYFAKKEYRFIVGSAMIGTIFPDLIDLLPQILNKQLGLSLPLLPKIFPWHWQTYSGALYDTDCSVSTLNYCLLMLANVIIWWYRKAALQTIVE